MGGWSRIAAGALALGAAVTLAPRAAGACTCATPRPQLLAITTTPGTFPAALPLPIASPPDAFLRVEDSAGRTIETQRVVQLPRLGLCETPWFLVALDEDPVTPGAYRLVRGANDADTFQLTGGAYTAVMADMTVTLTVETHDPITPDGSSCADPKIDGRPFSRTAHLSFELAARAEAAPMFVTVTVPDPATPGGLAHSVVVRPVGSNGPDIVEVPLEDGADPCADVTAVDGAGRIALLDRLCATDAPEAHAVRTWVMVPLVTPYGLERRRGCAMAGGDRVSWSALAISSALGIIVCAWRRRRRNTSTPIG